MVQPKLHLTGRSPSVRWQPERVSGRFRNVGDPWTPGILDALRWKLGLGPVDPETKASSHPFSAAASATNLAPIKNPGLGSIVATWIGHSTFLLQLGGFNILTDPIFSEYCSPWRVPWLRRSAPPALTVQQLPRIDLILISHAHCDHLDRPSLRQFEPDIPIACPLGLASLLHGWGFPNAVEFGWGDQGEIEEARLSCLPAQHGAARTLFDRDRTLWCGWMLEIGSRKIFFAGDTGYAPYFPELFAPFAPVDLALLPIGAYAPAWFMRPLHLNPEEAIRVHRDLRARVSIAMHWGTFRLADEPLDAPPQFLRDALGKARIPEAEFRIPGLGEAIVI